MPMAKAPSNGERRLILVMADGVIEEVGARTYGMCKVHWAPPHDRFDFERGFILPQPTCARVSAQAICLALDAVDSAAFVDPARDDVGVATKNKLLHDLATDPNKAMRWMQTGKWPQAHASLKSLLTKIVGNLKRMEGHVSLVYVAREEGDDAVVDLDKHRTDDGFDMEGMKNRGASPQEIEKALMETRMRGVMAEKLMSSGARCYRPRAKPPANK